MQIRRSLRVLRLRSPLAPCPLPLCSSATSLSRDRYLKRDELGVIYQLCVVPGVQRGLIGASLVREVFERSAYGCRLYCCWCAKDLEANYFWEAMGFVPIAFRAGVSRRSRVHIFWQKRIVEGDEQTKWWYPLQTNGGAIREDRIVFPIPPGVSWRDVEAVAKPEAMPGEMSGAIGRDVGRGDAEAGSAARSLTRNAALEVEECEGIASDSSCGSTDGRVCVSE